MRLLCIQTLSADRLLPDPFSGIVISTGERTVSIRTAADDLVTLAVPALCDGPNRVRLDVPAGIGLRDVLGLSEGTGAGREGQLLRLGHRVELDLDGARIWDGEITTDEQDNAAVEPIVLAEPGGESGDEDKWPEGRREAFSRAFSMARAATVGDEAGFLVHARSLVGLGPGLTPSGDDILVGFLAAAWAHPDSQAGAVAGALRRELPAWSCRTGFVSAAYLRFAAQGRFDQAIVGTAARANSGRVRSTLPHGPSEAFPGPLPTAHCSRLLHYGHTSGEDILLGILLGVGWRPDEMPREVTKCW